ncbi:hypothetical protein [Bacillus subtilis]|uniref:hypothetical protein n=1 Tax=Bacillus subtilis TaxID=1423 RepID=UPI00207904AD|nr:hypothetical protein [Bacillus subtilis]
MKAVGIGMVYEVREGVKMGIMGMGGVERGEDGVEFVVGGGRGVGVGRGKFVNGFACVEIIEQVASVLCE